MSQIINKLIKKFSQMPGLGSRSAKKIVLAMLQSKTNQTRELIDLLKFALDNLKPCKNCGALCENDTCEFCDNPSRNTGELCIVRDLSDIWILEKAGVFHGRYHVLHGLISALDGVSPDDLNIHNLKQRIANEHITDIIMALPNTMEGKTTSHYIISIINNPNIKYYEPASGVPIGGDLDYLDDGTLSIAFESKTRVN